MPRTTFEQIMNSSQGELIQLRTEQVNRILEQEHASGLLWSLDLRLYTTPAGELLLGFGPDDNVHEHDRWLFYSPSPKQGWKHVGSEGGAYLIGYDNSFMNHMAKRNMRRKTNEELFAMLKLLAAEVKRWQARLKLEEIPITATEVLVASRIPGTLNPMCMRQMKGMSLKELHEIVYHPDTFLALNPEYDGAPYTYVKDYFGIDPAVSVGSPQ